MISGCFLGVPLPDAMQARFAEMIDELKALHSAKYQKATTPHFTMLYFGQIREEAFAKVMDRMDDVVQPVEPFELRSGSIGYFGTERHPRVVWIGTEPHAALTTLHARIDASVGAFAERRESRAFLPHLTVARITSARDLTEKKAKIETIISRYDFSFTVDRLRLYTASPETHERQVPIRDLLFGGGNLTLKSTTG